MNKTFKRYDLIFIGAILLIAVIIALAVMLISDDGGYVVVRVVGEETARYSLQKDGEYLLNGGTNTLRIEGGEAFLVSANCPDKLCLKQGHVSKSGECITCLPNKLTVTVVADDGYVELAAD
jgi:hypothetical protein